MGNKTVLNAMDTGRIDKLRWFTVFLQMLIGSATAYVYCVSVYVGPLAAEFGWDPAIIVVAYTMMTLVGLPGSALGGKMKEKLGNKKTLAIGGIAFGVCVLASSFAVNAWMFVILFGCCASFFMYVVYVVQLANIGELFPDKRGLSMGLTIAGITVGSAMISPLSEWLVRHMDVMHTIALQGIVYGLLVVIGALLICNAPEGYCPKGWKPPTIETEEGETVVDSGQDVSWRDALKLKGFWIMLFACIIGGSITAGFQGNAIMLMQDTIGISSAQAAWVYSLWLIVLGGAGMVLGYMSDKWTGPLKTMGIWYFVMAAALLLYAVLGSDDYWAFMVFIIAFAFAGGANQALLPTFTMDAFGGRQFGIIYGIILAAVSVGGVIGPQLAVRFDGDTFLNICLGIALVYGVLLLLTASVLNKEIGKKLF